MSPIFRIGTKLEFFAALAAAAQPRLALLLEMLRLVKGLNDSGACHLPWAGRRDSVSLFGGFGVEWLA
ncbi:MULTISPECIES: hypothetical protein [Methylocystis]|uniref:hypothetical protein n=1 Tax=Methylocystis TaxID=133 RepID=UPI0024B9F808|nr:MULTISPECIES: hypothetical protein [Methylocystis]MDJ0450990.1 hypothetical protein [Methylocystis sp. JR02]